MAIDPQTPVLVGAATLTQRLEDPAKARNTAELMVDSALAAEADTGKKGLLQKLNEIISMSSMTPIKNPAQTVGENIGAKNARTVLAEVGTLQQAAFDRACKAISQKEAEAVMVISGETQYRNLRAKISGSEISQPAPDSGLEPDDTLAPGAGIIHPLEVEMGMISAPPHYALLENAFGHFMQRTPPEQRLATAKLWEGFSRIAQLNPTATFKEPKSAEEIAEPGPKNRPIAAPYNKWNCSQINVDYACALLFVSTELAESLNIDKSRWIFPYAGVVSNHMVPVIQRKELHRCPGFQIAGQTAVDLALAGKTDAGANINEIQHLDLYSCFPAAVWIQAQEMGIDTSRQLTQTGGMTFGGGPLNSYVLTSLVQMANILRQDQSALGMVTSISGMVTKQGVGIWSAAPPQRQAKFQDVSKLTAEQTQACEIDAEYSGKAIAASSTLLYDREGNPEIGICLADAPKSKRTLAITKDVELLSYMNDPQRLGNIIGAQVEISTGKASSEKNEFRLA